MDGGGVSDRVFALASLLGFQFAPRIPNLADRKLYAFNPASNWPALAPFIAGRPEDRLVEAHWDGVLRLTTSVRTGAVSASVVLERLGSNLRPEVAGLPTAAGRGQRSSAPEMDNLPDTSDRVR